MSTKSGTPEIENNETIKSYVLNICFLYDLFSTPDICFLYDLFSTLDVFGFENNQYRNSFFVDTIVGWNKLPEDTSRAKKVECFKEALPTCY